MSLENNEGKKNHVLKIADSIEIKNALTCSKATGLQPPAAAWVRFQEDEEKLVTVKTEKDKVFILWREQKTLVLSTGETRAFNFFECLGPGLAT